MGALIAILINALLPVAVEEAKKKIQSVPGSEKIVTPQTLAIRDVTTGSMSSKTMWFSLILAILGIVEQYQGLLSQYIGEDKMGVILLVVGAISAALRTVTSTSLSEKAPDPKE